jgi:hypothetical protein
MVASPGFLLLGSCSRVMSVDRRFSACESQRLVAAHESGHGPFLPRRQTTGAAAFGGKAAAPLV